MSKVERNSVISVALTIAVLIGCASNAKPIKEENLMDMKDLSGLKLGMEKDEALGSLSSDPIDSLKTEFSGNMYQSYYYLCKTGVVTQHNSGNYAPVQESYPVVHFWMTFKDGKLICKGPVQKYLNHNDEEIRKIGLTIEKEKGKMDGKTIYLNN